MRKKIVAGNWKMNKSWSSALSLAEDIVKAAANTGSPAELILFPPFPFLQKVSEITSGSLVLTGSQNIHEQESGAYTGEVSAEMVLSVGGAYTLIGHSERRQYFHENNALLLQKVRRALDAGLKPVFCCGESLEEREAERHREVVGQQLTEVVFQLDATQFASIVIAYEPVWAIGTGKTATADQAEEMHAFIRSEAAKKFGQDRADQLSILYGGSCKPDNAAELFAKSNIDGGLIGGASLVAGDFLNIARSFQ